MNKQLQALAFIAALGITGTTSTAQAALVDRGGGLIYDTDFGITWLADANLNNGAFLSQTAAMQWADKLSFGGFTEWRLPTALNQDGTGPCSGFNCSGSEFGHLFYIELGGAAGQSIATTHNSNYILFQNIQSVDYWTSFTDLHFSFDNGAVSQVETLNLLYAWAVHSGDVGAVPVPPAVWLFGSGLLGLAGVVRRRNVRRVIGV